MFRRNNSKDENFYKQTNNERSPFVACFTTSMINSSINVGTIYPAYAGRYSQLEDQYDEFIYSDKMKDWYTNKADKDVRNMIANGIEPREIWAVQEYCFNAWVGYKACYIKWNLTRSMLISHLYSGGSLVMGGRFAGYGHMVSVCGYTSEDESPENIKAVQNIIFDDPYGDPRQEYKPVGVNGNNVELPFEEFWKIIRGNSADSKFGVMFDPGKYMLSPSYIPEEKKEEAKKSVIEKATKNISDAFRGFGTDLFRTPKFAYC